MQLPTGWKKETRAAYEEGGEAMGRTLAYDLSHEKRLWKLVGPLKLWPRWYLHAFRRHWIEENSSEYEKVRKRRYRARRKREQLIRDVNKARKAI